VVGIGQAEGSEVIANVVGKEPAATLDVPTRPFRRHAERIADRQAKQHAFNRDVINPQEGHILCVPYPAIRGFSLRILWSSRIVNSARSRPINILVAFIKATLLRDFPHCRQECYEYERWCSSRKITMESRPLSLKSLRMGELQMNWLRSEDLKEVKVPTAPFVSLAANEGHRLIKIDLYTARTRKIMRIMGKRKAQGNPHGVQKSCL
jgi:hypothetical protein